MRVRSARASVAAAVAAMVSSRTLETIERCRASISDAMEQTHRAQERRLRAEHSTFERAAAARRVAVANR